MQRQSLSQKSNRFLTAPFTQGSLWCVTKLPVFALSVASRASGCPPDTLYWADAQTHKQKTGRSNDLPVMHSTHFSVKNTKQKSGAFCATRVYKPGSVLTAIYLAPQLLAGSSRLLGTAGSACCPSTALLRDRVYIVKPMLPWAGWALTPPFHPYPCRFSRPAWAVSLCCTCPEVTLGGRYPLSLPCGARTFLIRCLSACVRGCPTRSRKYCNPNMPDCQMSCKFFSGKVYYR